MQKQKTDGGGTVDPWDVLSNNPMMEFSNFPTDHHLYSNEHHMQPGFFKSEFEDRTILEFVGLSAKVYSIMTLDGEVKKTHKVAENKTLKFGYIFFFFFRGLLDHSKRTVSNMKTTNKLYSTPRRERK